MDRAAVKVMFPNLVAEVDRYRPDLSCPCSRRAQRPPPASSSQRPELPTVVFMTDSFAHGMWAHDGTDLFLVTSELAAASVRRFCPDARVRVRRRARAAAVLRRTDQAAARAALGVPADATCVLLMSGAWGIGPLD